jgi:chemotaxis protein methyltransferase CheR
MEGIVMATSAGVDYSFLRQIVLRQSQNVLDPSCDYLFETHLSLLLRHLGMSRIDELIRHLRIRKDADLERAVAEAMTIKETSFFRDSRPFDLLGTELLPALIKARRFSRSLRFWSAACSTGQEAYSLAMLLRDHLSKGSAWNIRVEGTDISSEAIDRARRGVYYKIEMNRGLASRHIVRHFEHKGDNWTVKPEIRQLCNFHQANLCQLPLPFDEQFDVIFLRNVMLYFSHETRSTLLAAIHRMLAPDGFLFLGSAEQPPEASPWTAVLTGGCCYYRPR